jgi:predicted short-subunit dehydrogenase-like oxidoreductase (DUF2520 family)
MPKIPFPPRDWPISIVGLGAVGSTLAHALKEAGFRRLTLIGKGRAGEQRRAKALKVSYLSDIAQLHQEQGIIILALPEPQIVAVAHKLSQMQFPWRKFVVLHTSGSTGSEILKPLGNLGAGIAAWHPYQTFPRGAKSIHLAGVTFGTGGNRRGVLAANHLTRALGGQPLAVKNEDRALYHLSAVLSCGFISADLYMAVELLKALGVSDHRALETVLPIAEETLRQVHALGPHKAMTGPAIRGDKATIRKHIAALKKAAPEMTKAYAAMTESIATPATHGRGGASR